MLGHSANYGQPLGNPESNPENNLLGNPLGNPLGNLRRRILWDGGVFPCAVRL